MEPIIFSIAFVTVLITLVYLVRDKKRRVYIEHCFNVIVMTKELISCAQKHRGLSASYLQGNQGVKPMIISLRQNMASLQRNMQDSKIVYQQERWLSFIDHWPRLKDAAFELSVQDSFNQHTAMIENLLYLLEDIAEIWQRQTNRNSMATSYLWHELPLTVECVGQARAVGMAVSTAGVSTQIDKVKLGYLHEKILHLSQRVFNQLQSNGAAGSILVNNARYACLELAKTIEQEFIQQNQVGIDSDQYFEIASQTMASLNNILDKQLNQLTEYSR